MPERPWHSSAFTPEEQRLIDQAYDAALAIIDWPNGVYAAIPHDVRHRQAAEAVLIEARQGKLADKYNMLALLNDAQKENREHFSARDIRDQDYRSALLSTRHLSNR